MHISRNTVDTSKFNRKAQLPYELRLKDFEMAMQDVYDFFFDVNSQLSKKVFSGLMICCDRRLCLACCRI